jgi:glycosidase
MPDFNLENPAVIEYHRDSLKFWLNRGLDGFRFDAVSHLIERSATNWRDQPESFVLMGQVNALMDIYQRRYMVCEGTANPIRWAAPDACRSAFAFGLQTNIADAARGKPEAIRAVADYFTTAPMTMATMMSNHDFFAGERLWDQVNGNAAQYRLAAATYLLLPGTPFIYYGEEIGMAGVSELKGDIKLRTPMSWTADPSGGGSFTTGTPFRPASPNAATQNVSVARADPNSILSFYKAMLSLRNTFPSIARGSYERPTVEGSVMSYQRRLEGDHAVVVINYGTTAAMAKIVELPIGSTLVAAYPATALAATADAKGTASITINAQSVRVFSVRR